MKTLNEEIKELLDVNRERLVRNLRKQWRSACLHAARNGKRKCVLPDSEEETELACGWARSEGLDATAFIDGVIVYLESDDEDESEDQE